MLLTIFTPGHVADGALSGAQLLGVGSVPPTWPVCEDSQQHSVSRFHQCHCAATGPVAELAKWALRDTAADVTALLRTPINFSTGRPRWRRLTATGPQIAAN